MYFTENFEFGDLPGTAYHATMCGVSEPAMLVVAGCIPVATPIFRQAARRFSSSSKERICTSAHRSDEEEAIKSPTMTPFLSRKSTVVTEVYGACDERPSLSMKIASPVLCCDRRWGSEEWEKREEIDIFTDIRISRGSVDCIKSPQEPQSPVRKQDIF
jgi:hypothetical protein